MSYNTYVVWKPKLVMLWVDFCFLSIYFLPSLSLFLSLPLSSSLFLSLLQVCLDEAQMVESAVTKPAELCLRLHTHHRWCVTGTPVQRDLNGRMLFLHTVIETCGVVGSVQLHCG